MGLELDVEMTEMVRKGVASDFPNAISQRVIGTSASELSRSNIKPSGPEVLVNREQASPEDIDVFAQSRIRGESLAHERVVNSVPVGVVIEIREVEENVMAGEMKELKVFLQVKARSLANTVIQLIGEQHQSRV